MVTHNALQHTWRGSDLLMQSLVDISSFLFAPICLLSAWLSTALTNLPPPPLLLPPQPPIFPPTNPAVPSSLIMYVAGEKKMPVVQKSVLGEANKKKAARIPQVIRTISLYLVIIMPPHTHFRFWDFIFSFLLCCLDADLI